jgi:hypothetical protein
MFLVDGKPPWLWASAMAGSVGSLRQGSVGATMVTMYALGAWASYPRHPSSCLKPRDRLMNVDSSTLRQVTLTTRWVGNASSGLSDAAIQPRSCLGRRPPPVNDRCRRTLDSRRVQRTSGSKVDRSVDRRIATDAFGSRPVKSLTIRFGGDRPTGVIGRLDVGSSMACGCVP